QATLDLGTRPVSLARRFGGRLAIELLACTVRQREGDPPAVLRWLVDRLTGTMRILPPPVGTVFRVTEARCRNRDGSATRGTPALYDSPSSIQKRLDRISASCSLLRGIDQPQASTHH